MIREQKFYDTGDFTVERLAQVGENYVADVDEDPAHRELSGDEVHADQDGWDD